MKLNDVRVANAMRYEEKSQRDAAEPSGKELEEALFILSESLLLQQTRQHSSPINLLSVNPTFIEVNEIDKYAADGVNKLLVGEQVCELSSKEGRVNR